MHSSATRALYTFGQTPSLRVRERGLGTRLGLVLVLQARVWLARLAWYTLFAHAPDWILYYIVYFLVYLPFDHYSSCLRDLEPRTRREWQA